MDILLAHAYYLVQDAHERQVMKPYPPLGMLSISAYLKRAGFTVGLFDSTFRQPDDFAALVQRERPMVVGIYVNLMTKFNALAMIGVARAAGAYVVLGGPEPPYYAADYLAHGADIVVKGEGEATLETLLPHLAAHGLQGLEAIQGIVWRRDDGQVIENEPRPQITDLSSLPFPDRESIDMDAYLNAWRARHGYASISVIHARGCPYTCTWCSHSVYGNTHRRRSPQHAADELLAIRERYNPDYLYYADDVFAINHRWLAQYRDALKARGLRIPFECISRADRLTEPVIEMLAEMGCDRLWNGSESGSQRILDAMNRKVVAEDVQAKTHLLRKHGIKTGMFIMLGYEGEEIADLEATVAHLKRANPDLFLTTVAYPIKGTAFYNTVEARVLSDRPWAQRSDRDLIIAGRRTRRFYAYATRWMVSEVALNRARLAGDTPLPRRLKLLASARIGRIGMWLTQGQRVPMRQPQAAPVAAERAG